MKTQLLASTLVLGLLGVGGYLYSQQLLAQPSANADLNDDGCIDRADYDVLMSAIRSRVAFNAAYDLNGDGRVSRADARTMVASFDEPRGAECPTTRTVSVSIDNSNLQVQIPMQWSLESKSNSIIFSNVPQRAAFDENAYLDQAFFEIRTLSAVNEEQLSAEEWYDEYYPLGGSSSITSRASELVSGRSALRIEASELGGNRAHYYIASDSDIIHISFGLFGESFQDQYIAILDSIEISD